jgi:hypothetical protein
VAGMLRARNASAASATVIVCRSGRTLATMRHPVSGDVTGNVSSPNVTRQEENGGTAGHGGSPAAGM